MEKTFSLEVGTFTNLWALRAALRKAGVKLYDDTSEVISKVKLIKAAQRLNFIVKSPQELGLSGRIHTHDIHEEAIRQGLGLCPPEAAIQYILQCFAGLNLWEKLFFAMKPLFNREARYRAFQVENFHNHPNLNTYVSHPTKDWLAGYHFVFTVPPEKKND